jgi:hypothetical protein
MYTWCIHGIVCRDLIKYTVIYGVRIRFWPTRVVYEKGEVVIPSRRAAGVVLFAGSLKKKGRRQRLLREYITHEARKWHLSDYPFQQRFSIALKR